MQEKQLRILASMIIKLRTIHCYQVNTFLRNTHCQNYSFLVKFTFRINCCLISNKEMNLICMQIVSKILVKECDFRKGRGKIDHLSTIGSSRGEQKAEVPQSIGGSRKSLAKFPVTLPAEHSAIFYGSSFLYVRIENVDSDLPPKSGWMPFLPGEGRRRSAFRVQPSNYSA